VMIGTVSEAGTASDASLAPTAFAASLADAMSAVDLPSGAIVGAALLSEACAADDLTDAIQAGGNVYDDDIVETADAADAPTATAFFAALVSEIIVPAELWTGGIAALASVSEAATATDAYVLINIPDFALLATLAGISSSGTHYDPSLSGARFGIALEGWIIDP
jgi:hypothetical protein